MLPRKWAAAVLLLIAALHVQALFGPLIYDDTHAVVRNTAIRSLSNTPAFFADPDLFSASAGRMYRPLVLTTLAIDHAIGGGSAWAFKLGNLLQHVGVCALLLLVLPRLFRRAGFDARRASVAALAVTLLFGVHPLHVETLCLVSSRSEILCALGLLTALAGWTAPASATRPWRQGCWLAAGTAIACCAKETGVLVPAAVLLIELLLPDGERTSPIVLARDVRRFAPCVPVVLSYLFLRKALFGAATIGMRALHGGGDPLSGGTRDLATQLEMMALSLPKAVALWVCPIPLALDHTEFRALGFAHPEVLFGVAFVLGFVLLAVCVRRTRPLLALAVLAPLLFAAPWILIPLNVPFAEHRLYLTVLFFSLPAGGLFARGLTARRPFPACAALGCVLAFLGMRSVLYQHSWLELRTVWAQTLRWNKSSFRAWCGLADAAIARGDLWTACRYLERNRTVYPRYGPGARNLREVRVRLLGEAETLAFADRTVALVESRVEENPKDPFGRLLAGRARAGRHRLSGDPRDVEWGAAWALSCLAMVETKMLVFRTAAEVYRAGGRNDEALDLFDACRERGLDDRELTVHEGEIAVAAGRLERAKRALGRLVGEDPLDPLVLGLRARYHARADEPAAWRAAVLMLQGLGYDTSALPRPPSLRRAGPR